MADTWFPDETVAPSGTLKRPLHFPLEYMSPELMEFRKVTLPWGVWYIFGELAAPEAVVYDKLIREFGSNPLKSICTQLP